jgi:type II restriction/modification system DNA methylase subunit YeeA
MPFLFERIDDESELLLPGNLERTDSVVAKLVEAIPDEDWNEVEVIGWLYQFYISEKKDQVIGKVVKSEDIPAATQLFTPNWIVQYLVQNSVGRLWLMANPASGLKSQWPYYIEPAEQTPEVQAQLDALIWTRMDEDGGSLNPETITVLDPACGSGHILVEAYAVLKGIYLERGYPARAIPRLILEKNLYGLDIDDRAAQLAGFALLMKARADDRRLLDDPIKLNVLSLQESAGMDLDEFAGHLKTHGIHRTALSSLLDNFAHAKTFGSLIQIPKVLDDGLAGLEDGIARAIENGDVFARAAAQDLAPLVQQAKILAMKFDAVVANPPYMGRGAMNPKVTAFADELYPASKSDLFAMFIEQSLQLLAASGSTAMVTMQSWMFLPTFEALRRRILTGQSILSMAHLGARGFDSISGEVVQTTAFVIGPHNSIDIKGTYCRLVNGKNEKEKAAQCASGSYRYQLSQSALLELPKAAFAYWLSEQIRSAYRVGTTVGELTISDGQTKTGDNDRFLRQIWEVSASKIGIGHKWVLHPKGGANRKWFGNTDFVINWSPEARSHYRRDHVARILPEYLWDKEGVCWSNISTSSWLGFRLLSADEIFNLKSPALFPKNEKKLTFILGFLNTPIASYLMSSINPTISFNVKDVQDLPVGEFSQSQQEIIGNRATYAIQLARADWDSFETSSNFRTYPFATHEEFGKSLDASWKSWSAKCDDAFNQMQELELQNNRTFIEAYGLQDELSPVVPADQITLTRADREKDSQRLISYAIGCMMGRYSFDEPGLIYAHAGNVGFDATRYKTFPADADGIIPVTDELWFEDDAANRIREFILAVWSASTLEENMTWLAESLGTKGNETPAETIRRYLASNFFKDHRQTYNKRPIYWLFSSGKQGAFQALVYLHRYHEGTLARLRAEYVVPLTGKMQSRIEMLEKDRDAATSTAARNQIARQIESLKKKHVELLAYDEKLRHYADRRITLDLDDGVKVNYGKFGDLLAEVKAVTGGGGDD